MKGSAARCRGRRRPAWPAARARRDFLWALAAACVPGLVGAAAAAQAGVATVAAASDLKFALETVAADFQRQSGHRLRLVFGSSGQFFTQIRQGAPFHLFMSADEDFVFRLADEGRTLDRGQRYGVGRIGLFVPHGSPLRADGQLQDLAAALGDGRLQRLAIANPAHAPYGARAREALTHAGLWPAIEPRLVIGENISQAAQFASTGAAQGGIVALSLALAPTLAALGHFDLIPAHFHQPLVQRMVLLKGAPPAARAFQAYLSQPSAQQVLARYGFTLPSGAR
jgi:molybdate transport system substrate-binding protein